MRAGDIDTIYVNGYGFPAFRGGPMWYADSVGLKKVYEDIRDLHRRHGMLWEPAPPLKELAESGKTFEGFQRKAAPAGYVGSFPGLWAVNDNHPTYLRASRLR